jgi:4'-phosphopantetheinyl transferase EntD
MLAGLLPDDVMSECGDPLAPSAPLFPEEAALVARAIDKRKKEFAKGRECARSALARLGYRGAAVLLTGTDREPLWPPGITGSITHTTGFCGAAVASSERYLGIGIEAEPAEPLEPELIRRICRADENLSPDGLRGELDEGDELGELDESVVPRLVFSAKESVYKCLFPSIRRFLGFHDVRVALGPGSFRATLLVAAEPFCPGSEFQGRWHRVDTHVLTALCLPK